MLQTLQKNILLIATAIALLFFAVVVPASVNAAAANPTDCLNDGSGLQLNAGGTCSGVTVNGSNTLNNAITWVINVFSLVVGIVAVIMLIFGGFRYVASGGDSGNISSAKNTILYAIVGLIIVALAQAVVQFVLESQTF